jgi:hypothetical protein
MLKTQGLADFGQISQVMVGLHQMLVALLFKGSNGLNMVSLQIQSL